jgi:drug/metabolite transporter (DMT)-like permease
MTASAVLFGAMAFCAKLASARLAGPQVAFVRFLIGLTPALAVPRYRRAAFRFERLDLLFYRGFFGGLAVLLYFIAIAHCNVGVATLLNYTAPIFSGIFSVIFIGERISARVLVPLPIALAGIFLVVRGQAHPGDLIGFGRWELVGLASGIASGIAVTAMRAARRTENSWSVYTSFCVLGLVTCSPLALASWRTPSRAELVALLATSIFAIGAQLLLTFSLRCIDAMTVGVVSQIAVIVSMILGVTILDERIPQVAAAGCAMTLAGVIGVVFVTSTGKPLTAPDTVVPES